MDASEMTPYFLHSTLILTRAITYSLYRALLLSRAHSICNSQRHYFSLSRNCSGGELTATSTLLLGVVGDLSAQLSYYSTDIQRFGHLEKG